MLIRWINVFLVIYLCFVLFFLL